MIRNAVPRFLGSALCASLLFGAACARQDETAATRAAPASPPTAEPPAPAPSSAPPSPPAPGAAPSKSDYLALDWARSKSIAKAEARAESARLEALGHELYRKHQDADALIQYERAIDAAATGSVYYKYGNSLSNVNRLADAIRAYDISLDLLYEHPEAAHYNTACALSRKGDVQHAYDELRLAIGAGYASERKILTDPDLANLRAQPDWAARWSAMHPTLEALVGEYRVYDDRDMNDFYTLCPNGQVVTSPSSGVDGSCCPSKRYGTIRKQGSDYVVDWYVECGTLGQGKPRKVPKNLESGPCASYKSCGKEVVCRAAQPGAAAEPTKLFSENDLVARKTTAFPDNPTEREYYVPADAPAKECAEVAEKARKYSLPAQPAAH